MAKKVYVVGHRNPDTDSVVSAIVFSSYLNKRKIKTTAVVINGINKETKFVLDFLKEKQPKIIKKAEGNDKFYLVDHGSLDQSVPGLKEKNISGVLDHHKMSGLFTDEPIFYRNEVLGSTASLIFKIFNESKLRLTKKEAALLLLGVISDTLKLTSPTTTDEDRKIVKLLENLTGIKTNSLTQKMFEAKSDVSGMKIKDIVSADYKIFNFPGKKIGIGVHETALPSSLDGIKDKIFKELEKTKKDEKLDFIFFGLIDILKKECFLYLSSSAEKDLAEKAFKGKYKEDKIFFIPGIVSRKKQIIPLLSLILK